MEHASDELTVRLCVDSVLRRSYLTVFTERFRSLAPHIDVFTASIHVAPSTRV